MMLNERGRKGRGGAEFYLKNNLIDKLSITFHSISTNNVKVVLDRYLQRLSEIHFEGLGLGV